MFVIFWSIGEKLPAVLEELFHLRLISMSVCTCLYMIESEENVINYVLRMCFYNFVSLALQPYKFKLCIEYEGPAIIAMHS